MHYLAILENLNVIGYRELKRFAYLIFSQMKEAQVLRCVVLYFTMEVIFRRSVSLAFSDMSQY